jgi:hypothetical protein
MHANKFEMEAQRALVRHVIRYRNRDFRLNNDHWNRTGWVLLALFEEGKATMQWETNGFDFRT